MEIIKSDKYEYKCYYYIDETIEGCGIVNKGLDTIREFLNKVDERTQIKNVPYRVVAYECDKTDGFSIKLGGEYIVGISIRTFDELYKWFRTWFSCDKTYTSFGFNEQKKEYYIQKSYEYSLRFLAAHEYSHIKNGHCGIPESEERFIFEQSKEVEEENALFCQSLEYDADCCAMACCINQILYEGRDIEKIKEEMQVQLLSVYSIFKIFSVYEKYDFDSFLEGDLLKYDHPNAGLRFVISQYTLATVLLGKSGTGILGSLIDDMVGNIMAFERNVIYANDIKETLFAIAFTEKGDNHIRKLHNSWEDVRKKLEAYAFCDLAEFEPIDRNNIFIDEKGNVARCIEGILK